MTHLYALYVRSMRRLGHQLWFAKYVKHIASKLDRALIRVSRGRLSLMGPALTTMLLTTTGRKSGKRRTVPVFYVHDGANLVAACENLGLETASSWPKNLFANPRADIEIAGTTKGYSARLATQCEIERNMPKLVEMWPAHETYLQRGGERYVFVFRPVDDAQAADAEVVA